MKPHFIQALTNLIVMAPKVQNPVVVEMVDPVNPKYNLPPMKVAEPKNMGALSSIPARVILIEDIHTFIHYEID